MLGFVREAMAIVAATTLFLLLASVSASPSPSPSPSPSSPISTIDVLIAFKHAISGDPLHALHSWADNSTSNSTSADFCSWDGVFCPPNTTHLTRISLPSKSLTGSITPLLGHLTRLSYLDLSSNYFSGSVPPEIGSCTSLSYLSLDRNFLTGSVPASFASLRNLKTLSLSHNLLVGAIPPLILPQLLNLTLSYNALTGSIPLQLAQCSSLKILDLNDNSLNGSIPPALGNLSRLQYLDLSANQIHGFLPPSLSNCSRLQHLNLYNNTISGSIPDAWGRGLKDSLLFLSLGVNNCSGEVPVSFGYLSKLQYIELGGNGHFSGEIFNLIANFSDLSIIDLWGNSFSGELPPDLGVVHPKLTVFSLIKNQFSGSIPPSLGDCSALSVVVLGFNKLSGKIPAELFKAQNLTMLDLQYNNLNGSIPPQIGNETMLTRLLLNNNQLTGVLPPEMGNLGLLEGINMEFNHLSGDLPHQFGNWTKLIVFSAYQNLLQGSIPSSFAQMIKLEHLILDHNLLSGPIPSLSNCTRFTNMSLNNNFLEGSIPADALPNMLYFDVSFNRLSGAIPPSFGVMNQLQVLDLSQNSLSGQIPTILSKCVNLISMNLSSNNLTGAIPVSVGSSLTSLVALNLSHNSISGEIPTEMQGLTNLQLLDVSFNRLSDPIPSSLGTIPGLSKANFSYNHLDGAVPTQGSLGNLPPSAFLGNPSLCGQILQKSCPKAHHRLSTGAVIGLSVAALIVVLFLVSFCCFWYIDRRSHLSRDLPLQAAGPSLLRLKLEDILKATDNFSEKNVIGRGGTGVVFKGALSDGTLIAFKRLTLSEIQGFGAATAELQSLGKIKHRNLVPLLGYFFDLTYTILFLEYMPNGSLDRHLHPAEEEAETVAAKSSSQLSWPTRLRIAREIAQGLAYLHHESPATIVHCDIKPSNILLDADMVARITDFGLARVMMQASNAISTTAMVGTLGYVAPEYASTGQISRKCDVYSYGIVVMEMVTGRKPTSKEFLEGESLVAWVRGCVERGTTEGVVECEGRDAKEMERVLKVALMCSAEDPRRRPKMQEVVEWLPSTGTYPGRSLPVDTSYRVDLPEGWAEDSEG